MESVPVRLHHPCDECGSSDAATTYSDGHTHCFSCGAHSGGDNDVQHTRTYRVEGLLDITYSAIVSRGIRDETCRKYSYGSSISNGEPVQVAQYRRKGQIVSQHTKTKDKDFAWINSNPGVELFGQHLWQEGGKQLIITEGEIDCLSWAQTRDNRWPVVALPGVGSIKMVKHNLSWISSFDEVILYFDMDEPGQKFVDEVASLLPPGKVRVGSTHPYKDSNEMLLDKGSTALFQTLWQAKTWRPAELTTAHDVLAETPESVALNFSWPDLDNMTSGIRASDLGIICAGTNVGKSFVAKNLAYQFLTTGYKVGFIALEETSRTVLESLMGFHHGLSQLSVSQKNSDEQARMLNDCPWSDNITFFTDRGEDITEVILPRVEYMALGEECDVIFIDHISKVFSQFSKDQRKQIDEFMYSLQSLCKRAATPVVAVAHLRDPYTGPNHNDGAKPQLSELNGSSSISRVPDWVLGVRRDVNNKSKRHLTELMCLKSRWNGMEVGNSMWLSLIDSPLLEPVESPNDDDEYFGDDSDDF